MQKQSILIIPGLGSTQTVEKVAAFLTKYALKHRTIRVFNPRWDEPELLDDKLQRLLQFYDANTTAYTSVVAYSAGGALGTALFANHPEIRRLILISCKLKGSNTIGVEYQKQAPALKPAVALSEQLVDTLSTEKIRTIVCVRPLYDEVVPLKDMLIDGATRKRILSAGHVNSIIFALLFLAPRLIKSR